MLFNKNTDNPIITIEQFFNDPLRLQIYQYTSKEKIKLLKDNALNYYIFEYFFSDIYIEDLRIEFIKWLNGSFVLSEELLGNASIIMKVPGKILSKHHKWKNFEFNTNNIKYIAAIVKFINDLEHDCNDKYLKFHKGDINVILLQ